MLLLAAGLDGPPGDRDWRVRAAWQLPGWSSTGLVTEVAALIESGASLAPFRADPARWVLLEPPAAGGWTEIGTDGQGGIVSQRHADRQFIAADSLAAWRACRHCGQAIVPQGPRPDWAAAGGATDAHPFPVLFCPANAAGFNLHQPPEPAAPDPVARASAAYHLDLALQALMAKDGEIAALRQAAAEAADQARQVGARWFDSLAELNRAIRRDDGTWRGGAEVVPLLAAFLEQHGIDPREPGETDGAADDPAWLWPDMARWAQSMPVPADPEDAWRTRRIGELLLPCADHAAGGFHGGCAACARVAVAALTGITHPDHPDDVVQAHIFEENEQPAACPDPAPHSGHEWEGGTRWCEGVPLPARVPLAWRWEQACREATGRQARMLVHTPDVVFHGTPGGVPGAGDVGIETPDGRFLAALVNVGVAKSPSGLGWGGTGSGPAALAWSLLAAALGDRAACPLCHGTGRLRWSEDGLTLDGPAPAAAQAGTSPCPDCQHGLRPLPYHDYAAAVVAGLPEDSEWRLTRRDVLGWLAGTYPDGPAAAAALQTLTDLPDPTTTTEGENPS